VVVPTEELMEAAEREVAMVVVVRAAAMAKEALEELERLRRAAAAPNAFSSRLGLFSQR